MCRVPCTLAEITAHESGWSAPESPQIAPDRIQVRFRAVPATTAGSVVSSGLVKRKNRNRPSTINRRMCAPHSRASVLRLSRAGVTDFGIRLKLSRELMID